MQSDEPYFSLFVDAAYNDSTMSYALGFAIFNPGGKLWGDGYHKILPPCSIMAAELRAIKDGISFWKQHQLGSIKVFSDSIDAIHSLLEDAPFKGVEEFLIEETKTLTNDNSVKDIWYCQ